VNYTIDDGRSLVWKLPVYNTIHHILTNPIYAGAYAFGRTHSRVSIADGRKRVVRGLRRDRGDWEVLIIDHHDGYLSWAEFERNQRLIADNATGKGMMARGAVRRGETLLAGLLRCGHCGRKLHVAYGGTSGEAGRYHCQGAHLNHGGDRCISFGSLRVDQAVGAEVLRLLKPLGVEAALHAVAARTAEVAEKRRQMELALQQARYEASHARRQYDAVDPDNRLVAGELERRWNETLMAVRHLEDQLEAVQTQKQPALSEAERERLMQLGADLELAWSHPAATTATRKRIVRAVLHELVVRLEDGHIVLVLHWQGGDHTELKVKKNTAGKHRWTLDEETEDLIRGLARLLPDKAIASLLNRSGKVTGRNNSWTQSRVCTFRNQHNIAVYRDGERTKRGELTLEEAAASLGVSPMTALRMIRSGVLEGHHLGKGAPWVITAQSVENAKLLAHCSSGGRPLTENPDQKTSVFQ
jgi:excisionase family DNA binding protein